MAENVEEIKNENDKKKNQIGVGTIVIIIVMIIIAILIYKFIITDQEYVSYKNIMSVERDDNGSTTYISYGGDKIIKYSRDGITAINSDGSKQWTASYDMKNPKAVTCGDYVAVADIGNKTLVIYDGNGDAKEVEILNPISMVGVSSHGIAAVVLEDDTNNYIQICDGDTLYTEIKTRIKEDGIPVDIAYSPDGKKLITSYIKINSDTTQSMVTFYNFSEVGKNYDSDIVMASDYGQSIIPEVEFINDNTVGLFADNKVQLYEMKEIPSLIYETPELTGEIKSIVYNDEYVALVMKSEGDEKNTLHIYSTQGKELATSTIDMEYENITISGEDIIAYSEREIMIITKNGNNRLHKTTDKSISYILPYKNKQEYYLIDEDNINIVKLTKDN